MSIKSFLFIYLLCLSMHACHARHFGVVDTNSWSQLHFSRKVEEKVKLINMGSIHGATSSSITEKSHSDDAITDQKPKESKALLLEDMKYKKGTISGSEMVEYSSSHVVLLKATKIKESRRRSRAVREVLVNDVKEEAIDSSDNGVVEDVVEMDYGPAHRSPPSHN